jgi:dienelactone hydrolase
MMDGVKSHESDDEATRDAVAERLGELVVAELPCRPGSLAITEWVAQAFEAGYTRVFAVNTARCAGPHCAPTILAELERAGVESSDRQYVAERLTESGTQELLRRGPLARVLTNALYSSVDAALRQIVATAKEGATSHARCVRLGHEAIVMFDHETKFDWLNSAAKHKVQDALAKVGCDPRTGLLQELDLRGGGKFTLPGYVIHVSRKLRTRIEQEGVEDGRTFEIPSQQQIPLEAPSEPAPPSRRWRPKFGFIGKIARAITAPIRMLRQVELSPQALVALPGKAIRYARTHRTAVAISACLLLVLGLLGVKAADVYANLSGESPAPKRPPGFYVGQYNKAGPWGKDHQPYGLYIPPHLKDQKGPFPLIVFLHAYAERTPQRLFAEGLPLAIATRFGEGKTNGRLDYMVLFLHDPTAYWHADSKAGKDAIEVLDFVMERHHIDPKQVYLTGVSMGGSGVWHFAEAYPERWAAIAPVGIYTLPSVQRAREIPTWIFHGERDVAIESVRELAKQMKEEGRDVSFTEFPGKEHTVSSETYETKDLFNWFATKRK